MDAQKLGVGITQKASIEAARTGSQLEETRRTAAEKEAEELRSFLWAVDKETLWEPLAKFTGNLGQVIGEIVKYAPGTTYAAEIDDMRKANVPDEIIARVINAGKNLSPKARAKISDAVIKNYGDKPPSIPQKGAKGVASSPKVTITEKKQPTTWKDPGDSRYVYTLEGDVITFKSPKGPRKGQTIYVRPGDKYYDDIMDSQPKAEASK